MFWQPSPCCVFCPNCTNHETGQENPKGIVFHGLILFGMFRVSGFERTLKFGVEWDGVRRQDNTWWFHSSSIYGDVHRGPESFLSVHERGAESGLGKKEHSQVSWIDRRYKRTKEERDGSQTLKCVHHQHTFHGSSLKVCDMFLSHLSQMKRRRFPTDCSEMELNVTAHFLLSCFSFIGVFTVPGPSWSALSSLLKMTFCIPETLSAPLSCAYFLY